MTPSQFLAIILPDWRASIVPSVVSAEYFDGFIRRKRLEIEEILRPAVEMLNARRSAASKAPATRSEGPVQPDTDPIEHQTKAKRTAANLAAIRLLASKTPREFTPADRTVLLGYSGWGGLSIAEVQSQFPKGFAPESLAFNEYYTPQAVTDEVARVLCPLLPAIAVDGEVKALEPSAGIGRFIRSISMPPCHVHFEWTAIELSAVSARMLSALRPDITVFQGPFERWVQQNGAKERGRFRLVAANPPYGKPGVHVVEDEDRSYREDDLAAYFMRRSLDLLGAGGIGVFIVPAGILTGRTNAGLRGKILRRHHLMAAYRLPSEDERGRSLFPGAKLVIDVLFFRARGGTLSAVDEHDKFIVAGQYYDQFPDHVLGMVRPDRRGRGEIVVGTFTSLPPLHERPLCHACESKLRPPPPVPTVGPEDAEEHAAPRSRATGVARKIEANTEGLDPLMAAAVELGIRVDSYLADLAVDSDRAAGLWLELHEALVALEGRMGNPWSSIKLRALADQDNVGAQRLLAAFDRRGDLIPSLRQKPVVQRRFTGRPDDVVGQAELLYRSKRRLTLNELVTFHVTVGGFFPKDRIRQTMLASGWCLEGENWDELVPRSVYYTGELWPKYDLAMLHQDDPQGVRQAQELLTTIGPVLYEDIDERLSPRDSWIPLDVIAGWMQSSLNRKSPVHLIRNNGLVLLKGYSLIGITELKDEKKEQAKLEADLQEKREALAESKAWKEKRSLERQVDLRAKKLAELEATFSVSVTPEVIWAIGWINHDMTTFKPPHGKDENVDDVRIWYAREWQSKFKAWLAQAPQRREQIRDVYNRTFRGFVQPVYEPEPLGIARYSPTAPALHPWQISGARRVLENRGGLVAFDVGVGKTYTALAILGKARQDGWSRRPVILVPTSIVWKWHKDIRRLYPDYRIGVVGSKQKVLQRGNRFKEASALLARGAIDRDAYDRMITTSENDTPQERAATWTALQGGQLDVVILSYDALQRTRMNMDVVMEYVNHTAAIQRSVEMQLRNQEGKNKLTERQKAVKENGIAGWVAQRMEINEGWEWDPGIAWDDIGIDLLIVDEAAAFKNLYMPEAREYGLPRFMGNAGEGSKRAWQLDFRIAAIHKRTGGTGVVLLTATPAKNSPLEYYNLYQYIDRKAFSQKGIDDPEQFIDRYLKISTRQVISITGEPVKRSAVDGFVHLDELRDIIFRYGEFASVQILNEKYPLSPIYLPELSVPDTKVRMDAAQEAKYADLVEQMERMIENKEMGGILGLLARLSLISVHSELDEGYGWNTALGGGISKKRIPETSLANWLSRGWRLASTPLAKPTHDASSKEPRIYKRGNEWYANNAARDKQVPESMGTVVIWGGLDTPDGAPEPLWRIVRLTKEFLDFMRKKGASILSLEVDDVEEDEEESSDVKMVVIQREMPRPNPHSPKFDAIAENVVSAMDCGHIIFCEPVAAHQWIREVLVQRGVKYERIAILNAIATKQSAERQRVAEDYNGNPKEGREPLYDVVIANSVAYEGVDLQRRTCMIHHADLPWTPADLEQRNGRGYRQGNTQPSIKIIYYFAERSLDGFRYDSIANKAKWQDALIYGKSRETNNPGAQQNLTPDQILIMISRNPEKTRGILELARAEAEAEARKQMAKVAARLLLQANARMVEARASQNPQQAARLRGEAEQRLHDVQKVDPQAWPWARWADRIRDVEYLIPPDGESPVFEGLRVGKTNYLHRDQTDFFEFGRVVSEYEGDSPTERTAMPVIGLRPRGSASWSARTLQDIVNMNLTPEMLEVGNAGWPDDDGITASNIRAELKTMGRALTWPKLGWRLGSDAWVSHWWSRFGEEITRTLVDTAYDEDFVYPVANGKLELMSKEKLDERDEEGLPIMFLPPTLAGWARYLALAPASGATFSQLDYVAQFWWMRSFPRGLLTEAARAARDIPLPPPLAESLPRRRRR